MVFNCRVRMGSGAFTIVWSQAESCCQSSVHTLTYVASSFDKQPLISWRHGRSFRSLLNIYDYHELHAVKANAPITNSSNLDGQSKARQSGQLSPYGFSYNGRFGRYGMVLPRRFRGPCSGAKCTGGMRGHWAGPPAIVLTIRDINFISCRGYSAGRSLSST